MHNQIIGASSVLHGMDSAVTGVVVKFAMIGQYMHIKAEQCERGVQYSRANESR